MKKVRIMLSAIAVMAVIGGALAFKAKTFEFCLYKLNAASECPRVDTYETFTATTAGDQTTIQKINNTCPAFADPTICNKSFLGLTKN